MGGGGVASHKEGSPFRVALHLPTVEWHSPLPPLVTLGCAAPMVTLLVYLEAPETVTCRLQAVAPWAVQGGGRGGSFHAGSELNERAERLNIGWNTQGMCDASRREQCNRFNLAA